ncbi:hypothetical protein [Epilithonimonas mollis]|nr:hypothetical protein [Epilithonimonas mollis]
MKFVFSLIVSIMLVSCVSNKTKTLHQNIITLKDSYCKPSFQYDYSQKMPSYNSDSVLTANEKLKPYFSDQSILMLSALQSTEDVSQLLGIKKDSTLEAQVKVLRIRANINSKINIALTELDAVAAEYDCEGERVAQMANYVDNINSDNNNKLILFSIVAGAATSVAGGVIQDNKWNNIASVGGGLLGAGLGLATFNPKGKKVEFIHQRNLLQDVWYQKLESKNFPPFVWYMFTEKEFTDKKQNTIIQNMRNRWIHYQFNNDEKAANESVNFGSGGFYRSSDLHARESMLNQLQSEARTINQNFNYLLLELDKVISMK